MLPMKMMLRDDIHPSVLRLAWAVDPEERVVVFDQLALDDGHE